ncbi:MAG: glucuronate isomerase [Saprospiraceae bacterium]
MLTDSRSFLSFPRHEYFRRLLCNLLGNDVHRGELPNDENGWAASSRIFVTGMPRRISDFNRVRLPFGDNWQLAQTPTAADAKPSLIAEVVS